MESPISGGVAVITGAASGIGRALAAALAARGCALALVDRDTAGLAQTAAACGAVRVSQHALDVGDEAALAALPAAVLAEHGRVTLLINNAGVALVGSFAELTLEEFRWLLQINLWAVVALTKAFLPELARQPRAQIVNISSIFGIVAPPGNSAYVTAKFAVRGFSEALRHELDGTNVAVLVVHPGGVATKIGTDARVAAAVNPRLAADGKVQFNKTLRLSPDIAAARILRAVDRRERRVLVGGDAVLLDLLARLLPERYWQLMARLFPLS